MQAVQSEFLAIDRKSRARIPFSDVDLRDPQERICDFEDVVISLDPERAMLEASRCVHCPDPAPCVIACPTHNDIPSAMWLIEQGQFVEAAELYRQTSSLPEICGRVCPHEQLCQGSCVRSKRHAPVLTGALEAFAVDYERQVVGASIPTRRPTGKKVAIVGAGPAGLACAEQLVQQGHQVTIFEAKPEPGRPAGLRHPQFQAAQGRGLRPLAGPGRGRRGVRRQHLLSVKIRPSTICSKKAIEAVFVGVGSEIDAPMEVPGEDLPGVYKATEFLIRANVALDMLPADMSTRPPIGRKVAVIGGGDTASDCLRTALRMGAEEVTCLYRRTEKEMPGGRKDRQLAREEGAQYQFLTQPVRFIAGEDGALATDRMHPHAAGRAGCQGSPQARAGRRLEFHRRRRYRHPGPRLLARSDHRRDHARPQDPKIRA